MDSNLTADDFDWLRKLKGAADAKRDPPPIPADIAAKLRTFGFAMPMGSGTFAIGDDEVSGGGTWKTTEADHTTVTGMGNYQVVGLVRFEGAPGVQTTGTIDTIGDGTLTDNRAGLAFLRIRYDDGSRGILVVSCDLPGNGPNHIGGAPESMFEGITASRGFTDYWNRVAPTATVNANRTLFHILKSGD